MWTVSKSTVEAVLHTMPSGIRLMDAGACLVIAEVVLALRVTGGPVQIGTARNERYRIFTKNSSTYNMNTAIKCFKIFFFVFNYFNM